MVEGEWGMVVGRGGEVCSGDGIMIIVVALVDGGEGDCGTGCGCNGGSCWGAWL